VTPSRALARYLAAMGLGLIVRIDAAEQGVPALSWLVNQAGQTKTPAEAGVRFS